MSLADWSDRQKYVFKRTVEDLGSYRGMGTELVTLYIPPTRQISDAAAMLRDEVGQASNIKSKQTATAVQGALTSMLARLKNYKNTPENGLALFVGTVALGGNKSKQVAHVLEPPQPVDTYQYRCDSSFNVEPLLGMLETDEVYGLMIIDRKECSVGLLKGKAIVSLHNQHSQVPSKHGRGGQSQRRFERLTEEAANEWFKRQGEKASEMFLSEPRMKAILLGGPGATKNYFAEQEFLHHELMKKLHKTYFDTGYTDDDQGLKELVEAAGEAIQGIRLLDDKRHMQTFLRQTGKPDGGLATYGENEVREALQMGAVEHLLLSEDLARTRLTFTHKQTGEVAHKTVGRTQVDSAAEAQAKLWGGGNNVKMEEQDLIEELADLAEASGSEVHIVSSASEEGGILRNAFGGVVCLLRYKYK
ncbi:MAG: peptide chain release factor aRF-1 [Thermoplasmatota archaeon]